MLTFECCCFSSTSDFGFAVVINLPFVSNTSTSEFWWCAIFDGFDLTAILAGASPQDWTLVGGGVGTVTIIAVVAGWTGGHSVGQSVDPSTGTKYPLYQTLIGEKREKNW